MPPEKADGAGVGVNCAIDAETDGEEVDVMELGAGSETTDGTEVDIIKGGVTGLGA